jgi:hypothetical protein
MQKSSPHNLQAMCNSPNIKNSQGNQNPSLLSAREMDSALFSCRWSAGIFHYDLICFQAGGVVV